MRWGWEWVPFIAVIVAVNSLRANLKWGGLIARPHFGLQIDAETFGDAVDVVEEINYLGGVADGIVGETGGAECVHVGLADLGNLHRHFFCPVEEGLVGLGQARLPPVVLEVLGLFCLVGLRPEVVRVGLDSVVAMVGGGHDDGEHFALGTG